MAETLVKFTPIATGRLLLRDFKESDLEAFTNYRIDPVVAKYQGESWLNYNKEKALEFYRDQCILSFGIAGSWYQIAIAEKGTDELLGDCVVHFMEDEPNHVEIGFTLAQANQKKGYAGEALDKLLEFLFSRLDCHRVIATVDVLNEPCCRLLERLRFRKEAHFIESTWYKGKWGSLFVYAMLRREFLAKVDEIQKP